MKKLFIVLILMFIYGQLISIEYHPPCDYGAGVIYQGPFIKYIPLSWPRLEADCPNCVIYIEYYRRIVEGIIDYQITAYYLVDEVTCSGCSLEDIIHYSMLYLLSTVGDELSPIIPNGCTSTIQITKPQCLYMETIDPEDFVPLPTYAKGDSPIISVETINNITGYFPCSSSGCCYGVYEVCWDYNGFVTSIELINNYSFMTVLCDVSNNCVDYCPMPSNPKIKSSNYNSYSDPQIYENNSYIYNFEDASSLNFKIIGKKNAVYNIKISNNLGIVIFNKQWHKNSFLFENEINISTLPTGLYYISIYLSDSIEFSSSFSIIK